MILKSISKLMNSCLNIKMFRILSFLLFSVRKKNIVLVFCGHTCTDALTQFKTNILFFKIVLTQIFKRRESSIIQKQIPTKMSIYNEKSLNLKILPVLTMHEALL